MTAVRCLPLLLTLALAGCNTPAAPEATRQPAAPRFSALQKGQTAEQIRKLFGEPVETRPYQPATGGPAGEVWIYRHVAGQSERQVPIRTREVPAVNPITGIPFIVYEPVYETQVFATVETLELLLAGQRLIEWKSHHQADSRILPR